MFPNGVYSYPKPKTSKLSQNKPQPMLTKSNVAETSDASSDHLSKDNDEETPKETRPVSPHVFTVDPTILNLEATPEPTPEPTPQPQPKTQSEPTPQPQPESEPPHSEPSSTHTPHDSIIMGESFDQQLDHETVDNSLPITLTIQQIRDITRNLDADHCEQPTSHNYELDSYIITLEQECIPTESIQAIPRNLPNTILSQPPSSTQNDIEHLLRAVNNNIRRLCMSLPDMSIEPSQIYDECKYMKEDLNLMIDVVELAYIKDFEDRKKAARLEAERLERIEREKIEKERMEQERIE
jgi:hypothetical protein